MNLSRKSLTPPTAPRERCAAQQPPTNQGPSATSGRGPTDCPTLDMLRLDDAAKAMREVWAGQPWSTLTAWEDIGEPSREEWRDAASAAVLAYGEAA